MSGPYNYGFRPPHGQSPLSPETPTSAYKTNLGRKKTKKWVEAKTQNYDGDDWGNDFDDEELEEPTPVPPLKPASRQSSPSQATTANLPSNLPSHQPPTPQSAGLPTMRPPQPALNESGLSTRPRVTAGLPPLQIQTPSSPAPAPARCEPQDVKPPIVSGPSSMDSVSDKGPYEQLVSPQSTKTGPTPELSLGRNEQPQSLVPPNGGRRTSPAPAQPPAQPHSTRFPPRKSSMGQHDSDRLPSSRSSSTHPPWVEQRSGSPSGIISPGASSTSKPSFVRPSDIYRRFDSEKDMERGSMDSGRPSLDSSSGPKTDRSLSPAKPPPADTDSGEQAGGSSLGKLEGEDAAQGNLRPTLAPVAERKSEYGFDNVLMRPQNHAHNQTMPPNSESSSLAIPAPAPEPQIERPSEEEVAQQRRYSSSPRLPDLARMSLFGDDFFSSPGKFADDAPPMPEFTPQLQAARAAAAAAPPHVGDSPATPVALSTGSSTPQRADPPRVPQQSQKNSNPPAQAPRNQENIDPTKSNLTSLPSRPSLPGGWVTETRSVTDEQTPPAIAEKKTLGVDPGEVSPISDNEHEEVPGSGVATVMGVASVPISISNVSGQPMPSSSQPSDESHSADAPVHPLAPLNAGHSDPSSSFVAPERLQRESTMSTVTSPSPVKESDKLREEIMRSLSPVRPTSDFDSFNGNRAGQSEEDTGPRESTYLHGVYDDYWVAGDDKPDVPELPAKQPELDVHSVAKQNVSDVPPLSPRKENAGTPPTLGRRFSWEAESEQVTPTPGPGDSQEKPVSDSQPPVVPASSSSPALGHKQSPALSSEETRDAEQTQPSTSTTDETHIAVPTTSGTMSHQVSQVSSVPRDRLDSENIEPPSPVSAVTDKNNASAAPPRRLSLAEEKSMVRVSSNPVSPSPPPGEHPALARSSEATSPPPPPPPAPAEAPQDQPVAPLKIINFKEIMEIQSASERINKYNETRAQFASMDSGLNNWLVNLKSQHPEHANATASFAANASNISQPSSSSPTASQPNSQQPYYQQYLNASSTNVSTAAATATSSGRPPAGSVSMGSHSPGSDFKHSSGQVGAKGKGLLLAAGKAGKGLLSKGKNKLRGTGDKRDSSPPSVQPQSNAKPERRTSWGISVGTRSSPRAASHAHSASFSGSLSGPAPGPQTIPEHPASRTPPPQLPQTSRISPFDALTQEKQASAWAPPRPQTPKHAAGVSRDSESEPVSPVSDTQPISAPNHHDNADDGETFVNGTGDLQVPRPIGKTQPSWDPFTGTPLVEEERFEMGQSRDLSPHIQHVPHAAPAAQFQTASTTKNARSDDDWVVVSPQSAPSEQVFVLSPESPELVRSFQPTESSREVFDNEDGSDIATGGGASSDAQQVSQQGRARLRHHTQHEVLQQEQDQDQNQKTQQQNQLQTRQQLPSQQQSVSPQRQASFVGLPPIRRSSTFGINLTKRAKKRFSLEEDDDVDSQVIVSSPVATVTTSQAMIDANTPSLHQYVGRDVSARFAQPARIETGLSASRKDSAMSHQVISATSTQAATLATESTGVAWGDDEKRALDPRHSFRPGGPTPHPIDTKLEQAGRTSGGPPLGMRSQQGVVSPTIGGNPIQHLPPQGPWKLEESHLSEPLLPASRNRLSGSPASPHQPFFGFDKETGVPSPTVLRQETQLPPRQKFSEVPPSSAQRYPGLFTPSPHGQPNPVSPVGPRSSYDLGHQVFPRDSSSIQRSYTADFEVSSVELSGDDERGRKRRSSGFLKEIGDRFSRPSSRERQSFEEDEVDQIGHLADSADRTRDTVSNMAAGEAQSGRQKRRSSLFLNLRGSKPSDTGSQQRQEGEAATPSPKASPNPASAQFQPPAGPAERKRSWLGSAANDSSAALPTLSRSSTSTAGNDQAGGPKAPPKKRFSGFAGKVFNLITPGHLLLNLMRLHRKSPQGESVAIQQDPGPLVYFKAIPHPNNHAPAQPRILQPAQQHPPSSPGLKSRMGPSPTINQQFGPDQQHSSPQGSAAHPGRSIETQPQTTLDEPWRAEPDASHQGVLGTAQSRKAPGTYLMPNPSAQQSPARLDVGQDRAAGSHVPTFSDSQAHALGIQGLDAGQQNLEHTMSLRGLSDAIASPSNGMVHAPDMLQRSSISASPQPPPVSQPQSFASVAVSTTREAPFTDRHQSRPVQTGSIGVDQNDDVSQQAPGLGYGRMVQSYQANKLQTQRSSLPQFSNQSHQPAAQGLDDEGQHSSVSKWFKNRTSAQAAHLSSHPGHPKESTTKSLFSAFKRSSKQPEARPHQQQQQQPQPQQMPPPDRGPHAQPFQTRPGQTLTPPPGPLNQRNPHPMQGPLTHQQQRHPSPAASLGQRPPPQHSMSSASSEISQGTGRVLQYHRPSGDPIMTRAVPASLSPTPSMPQTQPYQEPQYDQVPIPRGYAAVHGEGHVAPSPYDIGRPSPPAQYPHHHMQPVQQSYAQPPIAHRHPSGVSMYNQSQALAPKEQPQAPSHFTASYQADRRVSTTSYQSIVSHASYGAQPSFNSTNHDQSRQNTSAEQPFSNPAQMQISVPGLAVDVASPARKGSHGVSPDMRTISDAGVVNDQPAGAGTRLSVNIQKANQDTSDSDIYDATPRLPSGPLPPPAKPITVTSTGQSQVSESSADEAPRNATHTNGNANGAGVTALARGRSTRAELEDTEDERMRTMRLEAQEEKILVDPYEEKQSSGNKYRKEDDPEAPQMSATSYPGQEWNPYGAGGYEEWD
ncbi:hypothetical protein CKAH01_14382 [Colletotrichum kahawae]|uniref:SWI-SNF chromatin-remodeling complex protein n=1 Tax=Colletotrichum kahawae TaxID=34407 RepID=A0AAE0D8N6_COLKA|nr:hypothetical protein CKAH01_14382 [Colletotrichum kahawae]